MFKSVGVVKNTIVKLGIIDLLVRIALNRFIQGIFFGWILILLFFGSYRGYEDSFAENLQPLALEVADKVADVMPDSNVTGLVSVYVFPFQGPNGAVMADYIREAVKNTNKYSVIGSGILGDFMRTLQFDLPKMNLDEALEYGKELNADGVLIGKIVQINAVSSPPVLTVKLTLTSVADPKKEWTFYSPAVAEAGNANLVAGASESKEKNNKFEIPVSVTAQESGYNWGMTVLLVLGFILFSLLAPCIFYPLTKYLLWQEKNIYNVCMLVLYAAVSCVLFIFMGGINPLSNWGGVVVIVGFASSLWLNYITCSFLERLRK